MLQSGMHRFFSPSFFAFLCLVLSACANPAWAQPVQGLLVKLKSSPQSALARELPSATHARLQAHAQERMSNVAQGAGVAMHSQRTIGADHQLMRLASPLAGTALEDALRRLRLHPDVEYAEANVRIKRQSTVPNDPSFSSQQWHLGLSSAFPSALNMPLAWDKTTGTNVTVAVLDTGVRYNHPDLVGKLLAGYDFIEDVDSSNDGDGRDADASDPGDWLTSAESRTPLFAGCSPENSSWHGTFIAGLIAAATHNSLGVAGVSWGAKILPVRVSGKCGALLSDILDGMRWAAGLSVAGVPNNPNPARIINLSFGGDTACTPSYQSVIDEVRAAGSILVVAAGNQLDLFDTMQLKRPADCNGVLAVGAVRENGAKSSYSYIGSNMALMAPGGDFSPSLSLFSLDNSGTRGPGVDTYGSKIGTSFSAPLAAGAAALMLSINPALSPDALIARMRAGARPHTFIASLSTCSSLNTTACNCTTTTCGAGLLDANNAVSLSFAPAVNIAPVVAPLASSVVSLDGRASTAIAGASIISYSWSIVSGAGLAIQNSSAALASLQLPSTPGTWVVRLQVTDNFARTGESTLSFTSQAAASSGGGGATRFFWGILLWLMVVGLGLQACRSR